MEPKKYIYEFLGVINEGNENSLQQTKTLLKNYKEGTCNYEVVFHKDKTIKLRETCYVYYRIPLGHMLTLQHGRLVVFSKEYVNKHFKLKEEENEI